MYTRTSVCVTRGGNLGDHNCCVSGVRLRPTKPTTKKRATHPPTTTEMAFSFGGTPSAGAAPSTGQTLAGAAGGGGGLFSSSAPAPAPSLTTTTTTTPAAMPSAGDNSSNHKDVDDEIIASIPSYQSLFPNHYIRKRVEVSLARWRNNNRRTERVGTDTDDDYESSPPSSFAAMELIRLLSVHNHCNNGDDGGKDDEPVGRYLADPTPSIINFFQSDAENNGGVTTATGQAMRERLHGALLAGAAAEAAATSANNGGSNNVGIGVSDTRSTSAVTCGGVGEMPSAFFYVTLENQQTTTTTTTTEKSSVTTTVIITPRISSEIVLLARELHLGDVEALALYAEAKAKLSRRYRHHPVPLPSNDYIYIDDNDDDDVDDDEILHNVHMLVRMGQAGFSDSNEDHTDNQKETKPFSSSLPTPSTPAPFTTTLSIAADVAVRNMARHLYFRELTSALAILHDLIQHRVEAATNLLEDEYCERGVT